MLVRTLRLDVRRSFFTERAVMPLAQAAQGVMGSLEVFQSRRDVALRDVVMDMVGVGWIGLDDLRGFSELQ